MKGRILIALISVTFLQWKERDKGWKEWKGGKGDIRSKEGRERHDR